MTKKSISRLLQASLMCCLAVLFTACDDIFASEDNPTPAYLSMSDKPVTIKVGDTYRRKAISVTTAVVEYTSSDTNVATVNGEGMVTAIAKGKATITATATGYSSQNGKKIYQPASVSYVVTVKPATLPAATITTPPEATASDILAGSATALVTAGVADGGTMMYLVTAANEAKPTSTDGFSADIPSASNRAAGTYYVWYYAKADAQHADSEIAATAIKVTVKASYLKWDPDQKKLVATLMPDSYTTVENFDGPKTWSAGTYVVEGDDVNINGNITLTGNVELIIKDGAKLTVNQIYGNTSKYNLSIYGQAKANQTGQLVVNSSSSHAISNMTTFEVHGCQVTATSSAENRCGFYGIGTFNVYGGSVDAEHAVTPVTPDGYGIMLASGGSMNIYGGDVKAVGKGFAYGISGTSSKVTVYGGTLWAECVSFKALNNGNVTLAKGEGFTGKIETSADGSTWTEYTADTTPSTRYVRVE